MGGAAAAWGRARHSGHGAAAVPSGGVCLYFRDQNSPGDTVIYSEKYALGPPPCFWRRVLRTSTSVFSEETHGAVLCCVGEGTLGKPLGSLRRGLVSGGPATGSRGSLHPPRTLGTGKGRGSHQSLMARDLTHRACVRRPPENPKVRGQRAWTLRDPSPAQPWAPLPSACSQAIAVYGERAV